MGCVPEVQLNKYFERKIVDIFLSISLNFCFGYSKEPSHLESSFEYPQHMFWLIRNFIFIKIFYLEFLFTPSSLMISTSIVSLLTLSFC